MWANTCARLTICLMTHHFPTRSILMFLALTSAAAIATGQAVVLGVLEDVPGVYAGEPNSRQVRVVFRKVGKEWEAFPSSCPDQSCLKTISSQYPSESVWTISFDGRNLGQVNSTNSERIRLLFSRRFTADQRWRSRSHDRQKVDGIQRLQRSFSVPPASYELTAIFQRSRVVETIGTAG